ncbi:Pyrrolysine biosynthesis protein PylD [uncultured Sporomusa sp.]|uniref:Pyrrolysine biosynthesis protein PylD n=1 Tax=uncultured Sporomusa sp. TaxID=307249 RepID=A0A212LMD9_9FIRM|nr:3-methylornithyl-N6-L-lysine dehydrogenase PylD [uncultured Sporomusa sp.]SCM78609.1 Pyrrolysine biosynthesis protein PylD [uncultured Sporomusa sp.]
MTRLKEDDVNKLAARLTKYDVELISKTGCNLKAIAARAANRDLSTISVAQAKIAVIPITGGQGIIGGFTEAVAGILDYLGFDTFITASYDIAGIAEAILHGAEILFAADDDKFIAFNLRTGAIADNSEATGRGYVTALNQMCCGLTEKHVLVIGAGAVGRSAAGLIVKLGGLVSVYDIDVTASRALVDELRRQGYPAKLETDLDYALSKHLVIVDASPAENVIRPAYITERTIIAAPGVPLGVPAEQCGKHFAQILHDPLQIGVATMCFLVI